MEDGQNIATGSGGIDSGLAQVFKPQDLSFIDRQMTEQQRLKAEKKASEAKRGAAFDKSLGGIHSLDIFYRDQPYFAQKQKELYDWAKDGNATKIIKDGDPQAMMDFQKKVADLSQDAALSKNAREASEAVGKEVINKGGFGEYVPGAEDYYHQFHQEQSKEQIAKGEKPNWNFDASKFRKDIPLTKIVEEAQKIKKENIKTGGGYEDPKTGQVVNYTEESYPRQKADEIVSLVAQNPEYYDKFHRELNKLPKEEQDLYKDKDGKLDVIKYAQETLAPALVVQPQRIAHVSKGDKSPFEINFGNGTASTDKYRFVHQHNEPTPGKSVPFLGTAGGSPAEDEIDIKRTSNGENKLDYFPDPNKPDKKIEVVPLKYKKKKDGDWELVATPKAGGKDIVIPEHKVSAEMKAITGVSLNELLQGGIDKKGKVEEATPAITSQGEYDKLSKGAKYMHNGKVLIKK